MFRLSLVSGRGTGPQGTVFAVHGFGSFEHDGGSAGSGAGPGRGGFGSFRHLALRFFGALDPRDPRPEDEAWALGWMLPGEQELWRRMSGPDRRHAAGVARTVVDVLGDDARREVVASALLHDVGKVESGLGTFSRVGVTLAALALGRERVPGRRARMYLEHDRLGASLLTSAGSHPTTVAWTAEHHLPAERWTLDRRVAVALKEADGD